METYKTQLQAIRQKKRQLKRLNTMLAMNVESIEVGKSLRDKIDELEQDIEHDRSEIAECIIKKESDELAKQSGLRTKWDDQHIEVQYMIIGAMLDFSDLESEINHN